MSLMDIDTKKCLIAAKPQNRNVEKKNERVEILSKQLYLAENQMQKMQAVLKKTDDQLKSKDQEINRLKKKVKDWELKEQHQESCYESDSPKQHTYDGIGDFVHSRCLKLEQKLSEMEKFLSDYGLTWVGDKNHDKCDNDEFSKNFLDKYFDKVVARIEELNLSIGKGEMVVSHNAHGASFKTLPCITIKFYKNGMIIQKCRLRHYNDRRSHSFIQDILDGYCPSEFQQQYPNGVSFKIEDHRTKMYCGEETEYPGHGYQLGNLSSDDHIAATSVPDKIKHVPIKTSRDHKNLSDIKSIDNSLRTRKKSLSPVARRQQTTSSSVSSFDPKICNLRSQILASHNNNCSNHHIQSHINAEMASSMRLEKVTSSVKPVECHSIQKNKNCNSTYGVLKSESVSTNCNNRLITPERSSLGTSLSRRNDLARSRSVSSSRNGYSKLLPSVPSVDGKALTQHEHKHSSGKKYAKLRQSKSATINKQDFDTPIVQEVNEPTGSPGELRLKIRSMSGSVVYLVHISTDDTVRYLYQLLNKVLLRKHSRIPAYKIVISGFASKRLDTMGATLKDYGINRDSVLHLVND